MHVRLLAIVLAVLAIFFATPRAMSSKADNIDNVDYVECADNESTPGDVSDACTFAQTSTSHFVVALVRASALYVTKTSGPPLPVQKIAFFSSISAKLERAPPRF